MAEVIQFNCPVCGTLLRLPLAMAAQQGPCPNCEREIIAPDPYRGIGAFEIPVAPPREREITPFQPFAESPAAEPEVREPAVEPILQRALPPPLAARPQRAILVLSCLLTGAVALAVGFALGVFLNQHFMAIPPMSAPTNPPAKVEKPVPAAAPVIPPIEAPAAVKPPEPGKVSAAAEAALRAFLNAPDWAARSAYVLFPEKVRGAMEAYSHVVPDGPTDFKSIAVKQSQIDEKSGNTLFIFFVFTELFPAGIPVAIQETRGGWLVDWQAFVEFRDQLFQKFVDGPAEQSGRFHLIVTSPPPERAAHPENEHFASFLLTSPMNKTPQIAFVKKPSAPFATLQTSTADGGFFTPVLEVIKRKTADGKSFIEVLELKATDWFPREN